LLASATMAAGPLVGTLGEKPLHHDIKYWYADGGDRVEVPVEGFVVDLVRPGLLIEIQTRGFSSMKRKLNTLLARHAVRVVHPIASDMWILKVDETGELLSRRKSPRRGMAADLFSELVAFPELIAHPRFSLEVLLVQEEQVRRHDPARAWRRRGWVVEERRLLGVTRRLVIDSAPTLANLLPAELPAEFTTAELAQVLGRPRRLAQQMAYCLRRVRAIEVIGKDGNALVYARPAGPGLGRGNG